MSNIYVTEPPPSGKVVLETSRGDIEVELFADQCPLACKNLIALALEGYYDNITWHRYMPNFIIQTGDPTGTGVGGESFFGHEFVDEPHQRLRFNRRGLLGMANGSDRNTNASQFFLTLGPTPELQGRHTMFGRISSSTIYTLVALADSVGEVDEEDRPVYPPKLKTIRVIENPFEGQLQLRITREERLAMKKNRKEAEERKRERGGGTAAAGGRKSKNKSLLSFGDEAEEEGGAALKGPKSSHDLLKGDKRLRSEPHVAKEVERTQIRAASERSSEAKKGKESIAEEKEISLADVRAEHEGKARKRQADDEHIAALEASIRAQAKPKASEKKVGHDKGGGRQMLQALRAQYAEKSKREKSSKRDEETMRLLQSFQGRSSKSLTNGAKEKKSNLADEADEEVPDDLREYGGSDDDDDDPQGWRGHKFDFGGKAVVQDQHEGEEYVTLDPRDSSSSAALQLGFGGQEGQARAAKERAKDGRRGRDWVDERSWVKREDRNRRRD